MSVGLAKVAPPSGNTVGAWGGSLSLAVIGSLAAGTSSYKLVIVSRPSSRVLRSIAGLDQLCSAVPPGSRVTLAVMGALAVLAMSSMLTLTTATAESAVPLITMLLWAARLISGL